MAFFLSPPICLGKLLGFLPTPEHHLADLLVQIGPAAGKSAPVPVHVSDHRQQQRVHSQVVQRGVCSRRRSRSSAPFAGEYLGLQRPTVLGAVPLDRQVPAPTKSSIWPGVKPHTWTTRRPAPGRTGSPAGGRRSRSRCRGTAGSASRPTRIPWCGLPAGRPHQGRRAGQGTAHRAACCSNHPEAPPPYRAQRLRSKAATETAGSARMAAAWSRRYSRTGMSRTCCAGEPRERLRKQACGRHAAAAWSCRCPDHPRPPGRPALAAEEVSEKAAPGSVAAGKDSRRNLLRRARIRLTFTKTASSSGVNGPTVARPLMVHEPQAARARTRGTAAQTALPCAGGKGRSCQQGVPASGTRYPAR